MAVTVNQVATKNLLSPSKISGVDYVINPYGGCVHRCIYCYAQYMGYFTGHSEPWGQFLDVKKGPIHTADLKPCQPTLSLFQETVPRIVFSSVTDAYQPHERHFQQMRTLLPQFINLKVQVEILTKSALVTRDIDLLKQLKSIKVGFSINSLDDTFRQQTEPYASPIAQRLEALKLLHSHGLETYIFVGPIFPQITPIENLITTFQPYVDNFYFFKLNLKSPYKQTVLNFIRQNYASLYPLYKDIYLQNNPTYRHSLTQETALLCKKYGLHYDKIY